MKKCIKCKQIKSFSEFYKGNGRTCKACIKEAQKRRRAEKEELKTDRIKELIRHNYAGADVWVGGVQVMGGGLLVGQTGRDWLEEKIEKHIKWRRKHPRRAEEAKALV
jgi:hypothetical protein